MQLHWTGLLVNLLLQHVLGLLNNEFFSFTPLHAMVSYSNGRNLRCQSLEENNMEVPISTMNDIINYLARQPYKDVAGLIGAVMKLQDSHEAVRFL